MYLIAKESINILSYAYSRMDNSFKVKMNFDDFKSETDFQYSFDDFKKSIKYLTGKKFINLHQLCEDSIDFEFWISIHAFSDIENIISQQ